MTDTERKVRVWDKQCTLKMEVMRERLYWVGRQQIPGAISVADTVESLKKDGYKFLGYGNTPYGVWGAKMLTPREECWYSPEACEIHKIVVRAWEKATPTYSRRGRSLALKTYSWLHTSFFNEYHSEYMPSTEKIKAGINQREVIDLLLEELDELLKDTYIRNQRWEKRAKEIVEKVKDFIIYEE